MLLLSAWEAGAMDRTLTGDFQVSDWDFYDGMPSSHVNGMAKTPDGFEWFATARGLTRFDGVRFVNFDVKNWKSLEDDEVTCLLVDRQAKVWAGTTAGKLFRLETNGLSPADLGQAAQHVKLTSLAQTDDGAIWIATDGAGIICFGPQGTQTFSTNNGLISDRVDTLLKDTQGELWALTEGHLLRFVDGHWSVPVALPAMITSIEVIALDRNGGLLAVMSPDQYAKDRDLPIYEWKNGQWLLRSGGRIPDAFCHSHITALLEDQLGCLWGGTVGGGVLFQKPGGVWQQLAPESSYSRLNVICFSEDEANAVWIGAETGLLLAKPRLVTSLRLPMEYKDRSFMTVCARRDGSIWGGTDGAGVFCWREGTLTHYGWEQGLTNLRVNSIFEDSRTNLWVGTDGGVFVLDGGGFKPITEPAELEAATYSFFEDREHNLWIGLRGRLVRCHDGQYTVFGATNGIPLAAVLSVVQDEQGRIWIGAPGAGLFQLKGEYFEACKPARRADGTPLDGWFDSNFVRGLATDDDSIWLITRGFGLERLKDGTLDQWKWPDDGLPSNHHFGIMEDDRSNIWISSEMGIFGYSKEALEQYRRWWTPLPFAWHLTTADGLAYQVCSGFGQPIASQAPDGRFWFPDESALIAFDPVAVTRNVRTWPAVIETVLVDGVSLPLTNAALRVKSGARTFEFECTSPNILAADNLTFRHELQGLDHDWVVDGHDHVFSYNRLPPGNYVFRVMARGPQGEWPKAATTLDLVVVPLFYERRSVQTAFGLTLVLLAVGAVWRWERMRSRRRLARLKFQYELDRERQRIARDIHDDLGAGLTQIILLSDNLGAAPGYSSMGEKMVQEIASRARSLTRSMDEVVWAINPRNDSLESLMTYLNKFAQEFLVKAGVHCRWDVPIELPNLQLSAETRHNLYLASKEALNNIVKHAKATEVWIRLEFGQDKFCLMVEDNGQGLKTEGKPKSGNGLFNIQQRLEEIHGHYEIASVAGKGTRVKFTVPIKANTPPSATIFE
jgi:signal transduction histidine kinase/ligand-binding sensor domain-containing protein